MYNCGLSECNSIKEWAGTDFASSTRVAENRTSWNVIHIHVVAKSFCGSKVMGQSRKDSSGSSVD